MCTWESKHTLHMRDARHELSLGLPHYTCGVTIGVGTNLKVGGLKPWGRSLKRGSGGAAPEAVVSLLMG